VSRTPELDRRVRKSALLLMSLALIFYFAYIAIGIYRSRH